MTFSVRIVIGITSLVLWVYSSSALALEGVFGGPECLTMRFDFRANGRVFVTEPGGIERGGTYHDAGDKVAIAIPNDPGAVLVRAGDALTLRLPRTPLSPETVVRCVEVVDPRTAKVLAPDLGLHGCWQVDGQTIVDQAGLPPREVPAPKDGVCQSTQDATRIVSLCRKNDGTVVSASEATSQRIGTSVTTTKVVRNERYPDSVGHELIQHYTLLGDRLTNVLYGSESRPAIKIFKREIRSHRVSSALCIVKLP